jgi:hypothetical protein
MFQAEVNVDEKYAGLAVGLLADALYWLLSYLLSLY